MVTAYVTHLLPTNCTVGFKPATHFHCIRQSLHKYTMLQKSN